MEKMNMSDFIKSNFKDYAGHVIQKRAIPSVRDGLKPSARQIFYELFRNGNIHSKPYKSTLNLVGGVTNIYQYGDSSALGIIMRSSQPFNNRYPLVEVSGNNGSLIQPEDWAAARYTKSRLSPITEYLFKHIEKDTIKTWYDNYDKTIPFPSELPCLGFYPLIEGSMGIGVAMSSSIPAFNLNEMNAALINLLWDRPFELPMPDFPGGGVIINSEEVKKSLEKGNGNAAIIRSKIDYDPKQNSLICTELPPLTYSNKIYSRLGELIEEGLLEGVKRVIDNTGKKGRILIQLEKSVNVNNIIRILYKETALQNHYSINLTMLDGGTPKVFTLKEAMKVHLEHEFECYKRAFLFDIKKIVDRIHIVDGYIIVLKDIDKTVELIKTSKTKEEAKEKLKTFFEISEIQAVAILKLALARIANLEIQKFIDEATTLKLELERLNNIVNNDNEIKKYIEKGLREVMKKFGDARRTQLINIKEEDSKMLYFTPSGKVFLTPPKNEPVVETLLAGQPYLAVSKKGMAFKDKQVPGRAKKVFSLDEDDEIISVSPFTEEGYLVIHNKDKNFRCLTINNLNKTRTKLSLTDINDAFVTPIKITKTEYKKGKRG